MPLGLGVLEPSWGCFRQQAWAPALTTASHLVLPRTSSAPQDAISRFKFAEQRSAATSASASASASLLARIPKPLPACKAILIDQRDWSSNCSCRLAARPVRGNLRGVLAQAQRSSHGMAARAGALQAEGLAGKQPVALLSCGSFNPPTVMHLRMFDLARFALEEMGHHVVGAYMSPVNDAYKKANLAAGKHRVAMSELAAEQLPYLQADGWEAEQPEYQRTVDVLKYFSQRQHPHMQSSSTETARVMLLAGADLLETFLEPGIWSEADQETILRDYGVVCITRATTAVEELVARPGTSLSRHRHNIHIVHEPITNDISATKIRRELALGHPVRFLVPDAVAAYIKTHSLYSSPDLKK